MAKKSEEYKEEEMMQIEFVVGRYTMQERFGIDEKKLPRNRRVPDHLNIIMYLWRDYDNVYPFG